MALRADAPEFIPSSEHVQKYKQQNTINPYAVSPFSDSTDVPKWQNQNDLNRSDELQSLSFIDAQYLVFGFIAGIFK